MPIINTYHPAPKIKQQQTTLQLQQSKVINVSNVFPSLSLSHSFSVAAHHQTSFQKRPPLQRHEVDWEKVPFVPRPSLIADPITAFGRKIPRSQERFSILDPINRANIRPSQEVLNRPIEPYISARDRTRNKVASEIRRSSELRNAGGCMAITTDARSMDRVLPRLHNTAQERTAHRQVFFTSPRY